jgi:ribosome-interacting GTPase 1
VHHEGAAQVVLLGPPNSGKSTLHARLTGSHAPAGPYPFATQFPSRACLAAVNDDTDDPSPCRCRCWPCGRGRR